MRSGEPIAARLEDSPVLANSSPALAGIPSSHIAQHLHTASQSQPGSRGTRASHSLSQYLKGFWFDQIEDSLVGLFPAAAGLGREAGRVISNLL